MQLLRAFLVALALHVVGAQKKDVILQNSTTDRAVVSFFDVWNRSSCQPLEKLVSVVSEYPHEVEHVFKPSCVSLRRCCGCCRDEALQCVPVEMANITMELLNKAIGEQGLPVEDVEMWRVLSALCSRRSTQRISYPLWSCHLLNTGNVNAVLRCVDFKSHNSLASYEELKFTHLKVIKVEKHGSRPTQNGKTPRRIWPRQDALKSGRRRRLKGRSKKKRAKQRPKN